MSVEVTFGVAIADDLGDSAIWDSAAEDATRLVGFTATPLSGSDNFLSSTVFSASVMTISSSLSMAVLAPPSESASESSESEATTVSSLSSVSDLAKDSVLSRRGMLSSGGSLSNTVSLSAHAGLAGILTGLAGSARYLSASSAACFSRSALDSCSSCSVRRQYLPMAAWFSWCRRSLVGLCRVNLGVLDCCTGSRGEM